jgi:hypothetical protein
MTYADDVTITVTDAEDNIDMGLRVEEFTLNTGDRGRKIHLVHRHTWSSSYQCAFTHYAPKRVQQLQNLQEAGHPHPPSHRVRRRVSNMGVDEEMNSLHATDGPTYIPTDWLLSPQLQVWPPKRHRTVLWTLANLVFYEMKTRRTLSMLDYI